MTELSASVAVVRPIGPQDVASFHAALGAVARERRFLAFLDAPPLADTELFIRTNLAAGYPQFVAEADGTIVGWCDITRRSARAVFDHVGVLGIGIVDGYRGRGLGRRLASAAIEAGFAFGFERIELTARADNLRAISLYESLGFLHEGRRLGSYRVDGESYDEVLMAIMTPAR